MQGLIFHCQYSNISVVLVASDCVSWLFFSMDSDWLRAYLQWSGEVRLALWFKIPTIVPRSEPGTGLSLRVLEFEL